MSEVISQHCALFEQWKTDGQSEQNREDIVNDLQTELTRLKTSNVVVFREQLEKVTDYLADNILNLSQGFRFSLYSRCDSDVCYSNRFE